jgi:hypothetical protein
MTTEQKKTIACTGDDLRRLRDLFMADTGATADDQDVIRATELANRMDRDAARIQPESMPYRWTETEIRDFRVDLIQTGMVPTIEQAANILRGSERVIQVRMHALLVQFVREYCDVSYDTAVEMVADYAESVNYVVGRGISSTVISGGWTESSPAGMA